MNICPLCESNKSELLFTNSRGNKFLENYVCDNCGFVYTCPRISNEEINRLYSGGDFSKEARKSNEPDLNKFIQTESWALERLHLLEQKVPNFFSSEKTCLEIGCGAGSFSWLLKSRGHIVKAIEPDSVFVNSAIERYNIDVETLLFDNFNSTQLFDLICNFHVIEHVLDPRHFVKEMYRKLKNNGVLYIECPTIDNIYTGDLNTFFWDVHVNTFSNKSLPWLLQSEGFCVLEIFMSRGFVSVIAKKGDSKKKVESDNKDRIVEIIKKNRTIKKKSNSNKNIINKIKAKLKKILKKVYRKSISFIKRIFLVYKGNSFKVLPQIFTKKKKSFNDKIYHVSAFNYGNAGDVLLPLALQDTWEYLDKRINWINQAVYHKVDKILVNKINKTKGVVIGGGGLFLRDTNANQESGWQWPCSIEMLDKIKVPIVLYAVGYNRFREQEEFEPYFKDNITAFAEKALYIGLRNTGSIEAIKKYIPVRLHNKLRFQPCMTTFLSELYVNEFDFNTKQNFIAFNAAFDRSHLRFGENIGKILSDTALVLKDLSAILPIKFYSHMPSDESIIPFLQSYGVTYELVRLHNEHPRKIIEAYAKPKLVIGMRGHAQMIPFGCKTPILSIVSHNKMQWFLDDIKKPEWGVDVLSESYKEDLKVKALEALDNTNEIISYITQKQKELFNISLQNVKFGIDVIKLK